MSNQRRRLLTFVLSSILATVLPLSATWAQSPASSKKLRIAFANYSDEAIFGASVLQGIKEAAKKYPNVEMLYFDNKQDAAKSIENARTIIAAKPDAIIWYSSFPDVNVRLAQQFKESGLPVITVQTPLAGATLFAVDNKLSGNDSGKAAAESFKARWPDAVPQVLILGLPEQGALFIDRAEAAKKAILQVFPDAKITEFSTNNETARGRQLAADFLTRNPDKKLIIWAHVDAMGISALAATRNAAREGDVVIVATGGDKSVFPEIRKANGGFVGTFSFFPQLWGQDVIDLALRRINGETLPERVNPRKQLFINNVNINEYDPR